MDEERSLRQVIPRNPDGTRVPAGGPVIAGVLSAVAGDEYARPVGVEEVQIGDKLASTF